MQFRASVQSDPFRARFYLARYKGSGITMFFTSLTWNYRVLRKCQFELPKKFFWKKSTNSAKMGWRMTVSFFADLLSTIGVEISFLFCFLCLNRHHTNYDPIKSRIVKSISRLKLKTTYVLDFKVMIFRFCIPEQQEYWFKCSLLFQDKVRLLHEWNCLETDFFFVHFNCFMGSIL